MISIGIIGLGFVGNAVANAYKSVAKKIVKIDLDPAKGADSYLSLKGTDAVFVCVPSPSAADGSCDTTILFDTLTRLSSYKGIIICKTTAPPDVYKSLAAKHNNLVHIPEFLTAQGSIDDYLNETCCLIGTDDEDLQTRAYHIIKLGQPNLKFCMFCSIDEAAFTKYVINTFLATKVVFMNEMAELSNKCGLSWSRITQLLTKDDRVGLSHTRVPGPDGSLGFGGACFPKDTSAWLKFAESKQQPLTILDQATQTNNKIRNI